MRITYKRIATILLALMFMTGCTEKYVTEDAEAYNAQRFGSPYSEIVGRTESRCTSDPSLKNITDTVWTFRELNDRQLEYHVYEKHGNLGGIMTNGLRTDYESVLIDHLADIYPMPEYMQIIHEPGDNVFVHNKAVIEFKDSATKMELEQVYEEIETFRQFIENRNIRFSNAKLTDTTVSFSFRDTYIHKDFTSEIGGCYRWKGMNELLTLAIEAVDYGVLVGYDEKEIQSRIESSSQRLYYLKNGEAYHLNYLAHGREMYQSALYHLAKDMELEVCGSPLDFEVKNKHGELFSFRDEGKEERENRCVGLDTVSEIIGYEIVREKDLR